MGRLLPPIQPRSAQQSLPPNAGVLPRYAARAIDFLFPPEDALLSFALGPGAMGLAAERGGLRLIQGGLKGAVKKVVSPPSLAERFSKAEDDFLSMLSRKYVTATELIEDTVTREEYLRRMTPMERQQYLAIKAKRPDPGEIMRMLMEASKPFDKPKGTK